MNIVERSATSGRALAMTLLLVPMNAQASPIFVHGTMQRTDTSASLDSVVPTSVPNQAPRGSASGGEHAVVEALPEVIVTSLAARRAAGHGAELLGLYRRLTTVAAEHGRRVTRFVLAGEDLADSPSEDVILEVYVDGLDDDDARLDLWEALSAEVEATTSSPLLLESSLGDLPHVLRESPARGDQGDGQDRWLRTPRQG